MCPFWGFSAFVPIQIRYVGGEADRGNIGKPLKGARAESPIANLKPGHLVQALVMTYCGFRVP